MKKQVVKNSLAGALQALLRIALAVVAIPIFINKLGSQSYGVFALIMVIGNLNTLVNVGLTSSLVKFLSEQGKIPESDHDILVAALLLLTFLLPITCLAFFLKHAILAHLLRITPEMMRGAGSLYNFALVANAFLLLGQVFISVLDSLQRVDLSNFLLFSYNLLYWPLIILSAISGLGLWGVGLAVSAASVIWFTASMLVALRQWGALNFGGLRASFMPLAKKQIRYGIHIYVSGLMSLLFEPMTKVLLSHFVGVTEVGFYDIAIRIRNYVWNIISKIFYPLYPLITATDQGEKVRFIVHDIEQKVLIVVVPMIAAVILVARPLVTLWMGSSVRMLSISIAVIVSTYLIGSSVIPNYYFLTGKNLASKTVMLQAVNVVVNAVVFLAAVWTLGYYAAIIGNGAAILSSFGLSVWYQKKYLDSLIFDSSSQALKLIAVFVSLMLVGYFTVIIMPSDILKLLMVPIVICVFAVILYRLSALLTPADIRRYFGEQGLLSRVGMKILCKS